MRNQSWFARIISVVIGFTLLPGCMEGARSGRLGKKATLISHLSPAEVPVASKSTSTQLTAEQESEISVIITQLLLDDDTKTVTPAPVPPPASTYPYAAGSRPLSEGYVAPLNKQGIGESFVDLPTNVFEARYRKIQADIQPGIRIYNIYWGSFEASGIMSSPNPISCPAGTFMVPANAEQKAQFGFRRYRCMSQGAVADVDKMISRDPGFGIQSAAVLWSAPPQYRDPGCVAQVQNIMSGLPCVPTENGPYDYMEDYEDWVTFLGHRYNGSSLGKIHHFVVWNEVNSQLWFDTSHRVNENANYPSATDKAYWLDRYANMMRRTHDALKRVTKGVLVYASLTATWTRTSGDYTEAPTHIGSRDLIEGLWTRLGLGVEWSLAVHAYGDDPWANVPDQTNFAGLQKVYDYQAAQIQTRLGAVNPLNYPQTKIFNSEQGWFQSYGMENSAKNVCKAHHTVTNMPFVIGVTHNNFQHAAGGFDFFGQPDGWMKFGLVPYDAGLALENAEQYSTYQAYKASRPDTWGKSSFHYCCTAHNLGCPTLNSAASVKGASRPAFPDFNNDKFADYADHKVVTGDAYSGYFWVHKNNGNGTFDRDGYISVGTSTVGPGWQNFSADFTGDGFADIMDYNLDSGNFYIRANLVNGSFAPARSDWAWGKITASPQVELLVGNFNEDLRADLAERHLQTGQIRILFNNGPGADTFRPINGGSTFRSATGGTWRVLVADFTGDKLADIADYDPNQATFWVHRNLGASTGYDFHSEAPLFGRGTPGWKIFVGDFSGDGFADFGDLNVATGEFWVRPNKQNGTFGAAGDNWGAGKCTRSGSDWRMLNE